MKALTPAEAIARNLSAKAHAATERSSACPFDQLPLPYLEIDAHGIITSANRSALALYPAERGELIGKMAWELMAANEKEPSFADYCSTLESGDEPAVVRHSLYDRSGQFRTYEMYRSLMRDVDGTSVGMRILCVDITESKNALEEASRKSLRYQSVFDSFGEAAIVIDAVGFIRAVNPAAEALLGWKAPELIDRSIEEGLPLKDYRSGDCTDLKFASALEGRTKGIATTLDREGRLLQISLGTSPIFDKENGSTLGVVMILGKLELPV